MTEQQTAIEWRQGERSASHGYVGKARVFTCVYGIVRDTETPWELHSKLPGIKMNTQHATPDAAKAAAEVQLKIVLNTLTKAGVRVTPSDERVDRAAQAIARTRLQQDAPNSEMAWDDKNWADYWDLVLTDRVRKSYYEQARAALDA